MYLRLYLLRIPLHGTPGAVAESVKHEPRMRKEDRGFEHWSSQTNDLKRLYLSCPRVDIIRIEQGMGGSVSG